jgi:hypothetical protein
MKTLPFTTHLFKVCHITHGLKSNGLLRTTIRVCVNNIQQRCVLQPRLYSRVITHLVNCFIYARESNSDCTKQTLQNVTRKAYNTSMGRSTSIPCRNRNFTLRRCHMIISAFSPALYTGSTVRSGICSAPCTGGTVRSVVSPAPYTGGTVGSGVSTAHFTVGNVRSGFFSAPYKRGTVRSGVSPASYTGGTIRSGVS